MQTSGSIERMAPVGLESVETIRLKPGRHRWYCVKAEPLLTVFQCED